MHEGRKMTPCGLGKKAGMTDEQAQCYKERYPDLGKLKKKELKKHWHKHGRKEGRNKYCAPKITTIESYCMLARYDDLMEKYGNIMDKVQSEFGDHRLANYWQQKGFDEARDPSCEEFGASLNKCADEGEDCSCPFGHIYFTRTFNGAQGISDPHDALNYRHAMVDFEWLEHKGKDPFAPFKCDKQNFPFDPFKEGGDYKGDGMCLC